MFDYAERRRRLSQVMAADGVDLLFLGLSSDLEYLSGVDRGIPFFGQSSYPHGWVAGGFFRAGGDPVYVLPRMVVVFDLPVRPEGEIVVVERDRRRACRVRACGQEPRGRVGCGRCRRPRLGGDDAAARPHLRRGSPPHRVRARQPAAAREDGRRARRDGAGVPHGRTGDGGRHAARAAGRHDVGARGGGRAPASTGRLSDAFLRDSHLHGCGSGQPRQPRRERARAARRTGRRCCSTSAASWTATARTSGGPSSPASRRRSFATRTT